MAFGTRKDIYHYKLYNILQSVITLVSHAYDALINGCISYKLFICKRGLNEIVQRVIRNISFSFPEINLRHLLAIVVYFVQRPAKNMLCYMHRVAGDEMKNITKNRFLKYLAKIPINPNLYLILTY